MEMGSGLPAVGQAAGVEDGVEIGGADAQGAPLGEAHESLGAAHPFSKLGLGEAGLTAGGPQTRSQGLGPGVCFGRAATLQQSLDR